MTIDAHQLTKRKVKLFLMTSKRLFKVKKEKETNDSALFFSAFVGGISNNVRGTRLTNGKHGI